MALLVQSSLTHFRWIGLMFTSRWRKDGLQTCWVGEPWAVQILDENEAKERGGLEVPPLLLVALGARPDGITEQVTCKTSSGRFVDFRGWIQEIREKGVKAMHGVCNQDNKPACAMEEARLPMSCDLLYARAGADSERFRGRAKQLAVHMPLQSSSSRSSAAMPTPKGKMYFLTR
jgi:hypothetical protein